MKILRPQSLPILFIRKNVNEGLSSSINLYVRVVICIQPVAFVIEDVALAQRRPPSDNPAFLRAKTVVRFLGESANVDAVHESGHGHEARADVVVNSLIG